MTCLRESTTSLLAAACREARPDRSTGICPPSSQQPDWQPTTATATSRWVTTMRSIFTSTMITTHAGQVQLPDRYAAARASLMTSAERSETFRDTYPSAEEYISTKEQYGCPTCVSLGPNGYYFIRTAWGCHYNLPTDAKSHLGNMTHVEHMFFGANGAWVALKFGGARSWDLKGLYPGLEARIRDGPGVPTNIRVSIVFLTRPSTSNT